MEEQARPLTAKEQRFVEEYCKDCNAAQAAVRAGYSVKGAKVQGHRLLTNANIRKAIDARLAELSLSAAEVTKRISDIAHGSLNDYYVVKEVEHTPRVEKHLYAVIQDIRQEMEFEEVYAERIGMEGKELERHQAEQARRERQIIRLELQLERNPNATMFVDGKPTLKKVAELDMAKLVQDTERGRIKSVKPGEFGLTVEMYPADAALDKLAKMHGLYEKDNEQSKAVPIVQTTVTILPAPKKIATSEKEVEL